MQVKQQQKQRGGHIGDAKQRRQLGKETNVCQILLGVNCVCGDEDACVEGDRRECDDAEEN